MEIKYKKEEILFFLSSLLSTFTQLVKYVARLMEINIQKKKKFRVFFQLHVVNIYTTSEVCWMLNGNQNSKTEKFQFFSALCCQYLHNLWRFIFLYKNYRNCLVCFQIDSDKVDLILKYNNFIVVTDQKMSPFSLVMQWYDTGSFFA